MEKKFYQKLFDGYNIIKFISLSHVDFKSIEDNLREHNIPNI